MSTWGSPADSSRSRVAHQATERYLGHMPTTGGLKLALQAATRGDRRLRFAQVKLRTAGIEDALSLVTDARGRMRTGCPTANISCRFSVARACGSSCVIAAGPRSAFSWRSRGDARERIPRRLGRPSAGLGASRWRAEADPLARRADVSRGRRGS